MSVETSLAYQQKFFDDFVNAWQNHSDYRLYKGIDGTASTLRLDIHEVPGYILAYDKSAQEELHHFLRGNLVKWLREYVPFFEVSDDGHVFFGDWYHRREFGTLDVFSREIVHQNEQQQEILPQLQAFAQDPDHYLDDQVDRLRKSVYQEATDLHAQIDDYESVDDDDQQPETRTASNGSTGSGSGLRGLLKNFIDPDDDDDDSSQPAATPLPSRRNRHGVDINRLRRQFADAKEAADQKFDGEKRQLEVAAAVTRYEYQAVMSQYSSIDQFINVLANLSKDYMKTLRKQEEAKRHA
ncbi:SbcC family exonuclease [Lacticaseibacillus zhaodongensis]|uniref:SbcC family exonuclease n=1 Tax=Lacticaseibacillus zhaodongensis TaxID=2668065 RepID=UPI0012D345D0|nr:SbcC family exonuclease [Lacticaseibacillus zhaodongensis]